MGRGAADARQDLSRPARQYRALHRTPLSPCGPCPFGLAPVSHIRLQTTSGRSPLAVSPLVTDFAAGALDDAATRWRDRAGDDAGHRDQVDAIADWARAANLEQIVTPYAPVGPVAEALDKLDTALAPDGITVIRPLRPYDARAWPHATHGFFRFKDQIPQLLTAMGL